MGRVGLPMRYIYGTVDERHAVDAVEHTIVYIGVSTRLQADARYPCNANV